MLNVDQLNTLSDADLITEVKKNKNSDAISILSQRHSGIYCKIAKRYKSNPYVSYTDVIDNKDFVIWKAAVKFDNEKGSFANLVANMARFECYSMITDCKRQKMSQKTDIDTVGEIAEVNGKSEYSHLISYIEELLPEDPKTKQIILDRFINGGSKPTPWREVAKKNGMSHWGCVLKTQEFIRNIQEKLKKEYIEIKKSN